MTRHRPRFFDSDAEVMSIGEHFLACALPRSAWTHEAHLAAVTYLLVMRPDIPVEKELPTLIRRYNESVGGINSDTEGYHETITRMFLEGARMFLAEADRSEPLHELVNRLLMSPMGSRDWPMRFYSRELLFSVAARRHFVEPDLGGLRPIRARASPRTNHA
jgi:hypothetical protein